MHLQLQGARSCWEYPVEHDIGTAVQLQPTKYSMTLNLLIQIGGCKPQDLFNNL